MTLVGTFVCRERGEVFLTDDDLARFEKHQVAMALVIAMDMLKGLAALLVAYALTHAVEAYITHGVSKLCRDRSFSRF